MKMSQFSFLLIASLAIPMVSPAQAQVETIFTAVPPGGPPGVEFHFPNFIPPMPDHKVFHFIGGAESHGFPDPSTLLIVFDWEVGPMTFYSPPMPFLLAPFMTNPIDTIPFILPFCPERVSIHFETSSPFGASVSGSFSHICEQIPEPNLLAWGPVMGVLSAMLMSRRHRK